MKKNARRNGVHLDAMTATVAALSIVTVTFLLTAAAGIVYAGIGTRPAAAAALPPPPAPPPVALPASRFVAPAFAALAPAAPPAPMASAVVEVVAAANASPLDEWIAMQPVALPDWRAIHIADAAAVPLAPSAYRALIRDAAMRRALDPELVEAIARVESDFNPYEVSHKGALGLMQVIPATGKRFGVERERLFDPQDNLAAGTAYLAWLLDRYHGDLDLALAAYNAGEGAVDRHRGIPPYRETQQYVKRVRAALKQIEARLN
jgi:soluble lytic murein transglycosylase-like protein